MSGGEQEWHEAQLPPQCLQSPQLIDFPAFLSFRSFKMIAVMMAIRTIHITIVPQFAAKNPAIIITSL